MSKTNENTTSVNAHQKGWIAGAVWGVAEVLRTYGEEVLARHMLSAIGGLEKVRKHAEPCDIEEIEKYPWVHEANDHVEAPPPRMPDSK